jgi:hypothetical protein
MRSEYPQLRNAARGESCVRCGAQDETVVGAHYTGYRRLSYGGGLGRKVHDLLIAHLCENCHHWMDTESREKHHGYEHSEEFQHLILLTLLRLLDRDVIAVRGARK